MPTIYPVSENDQVGSFIAWCVFGRDNEGSYNTPARQPNLSNALIVCCQATWGKSICQTTALVWFPVCEVQIRQISFIAEYWQAYWKIHLPNTVFYYYYQIVFSLPAYRKLNLQSVQQCASYEIKRKLCISCCRNAIFIFFLFLSTHSIGSTKVRFCHVALRTNLISPHNKALCPYPSIYSCLHINNIQGKARWAGDRHSPEKTQYLRVRLSSLCTTCCHN